MADAAESQRYLRPRRKQAHGKRYRADGSRLRQLLAAVFLLSSAALTGAFAHQQLQASESLRVRTVGFAGVERVIGPELDPVALAIVGRSILTLDLAAVGAELGDALPWIAQARLRRVFPDRIEIAVVEHRAVARAVDRASLLTADGRLLPSSPAMPGDGDLPSLTVGQEETWTALPMAVELLAILERGTSQLAARIAMIDVSDPSDFVLRLTDVSYELHLGNTEFRRRLNRYLNAESLLRSRYEAIQSVDLRFDRRVIVAPVDDLLPHAGG